MGYARFPSNGSRDAGHELDLAVSYRPYSPVTLSLGFSHLWGGAAFRSLADQAAAFGWAQIGIQY